MPDPLARSLLAEIARHLDALALRGEDAAIDLRSLPLTAAGRAALTATLGRGEVAITIDAAGRSEIFETAFPGVWWVCHFGAGGALLAERIEVAAVPETLAASAEDHAEAANRLAAMLQSKEVANA